ncbi:Hypothetical protein CINCED_3A025463 [Cinara cedri]|uniref:Max-binding protein MNT n=1 Tax=Cinara cedri TaxID=506608 RepID=A0A5E4MSZ1_9HEMI|nr:Hypothetical protein CINCED_3A025463 [Cinara cedri]
MSMRCGLQTLLEAARFVELQEEFEKQQLVTLHAAEPLSNSKDAVYHQPASVTLPSSDLPASLNHIEPPSTPPRQQQPPPPPPPSLPSLPPQPQHQQQHHHHHQPQQHPLQLHQQAAPALIQQQQQQQQQQQLIHHYTYKPTVAAPTVAAVVTTCNTTNNVIVVNNNHDDNVAALSLAQELKRRTGSGTREVHNKLEKNRRAHLKECFELLKKQVPASQDEKKTSNLSILRSAIRYIQVLRRRERELEHEMERLARDKIWAQQRHASLKKELAAKWDHIDFSKLLPDLPPDGMTRKNAITTSINGDFETERDASMVTSDADDSKLSALYSSTSSLSSSSPPTLPLVSDITPHQVKVVSTSPMMGSTIHIVPQTRNSSSLPCNTLQQQTLTFVHHKDALNQQDSTQAVLTKVSNGSFTLYGDPKLTPNRSKVSLAGIKIGTSVIDHSNNTTTSAPIRLLQNNIIASQTSVVNRGPPTPNHVITRPLLLTHHTNSSPAHLVLSTASSKAVTIPNQQLPPLSNGHLLVKPSAMVVMNSSQPKSHHSGHKA